MPTDLTCLSLLLLNACLQTVSPLTKQMLISFHISGTVLCGNEKKMVGEKKKTVLSSLGLSKGKGTGNELRGVIAINKVPDMSCDIFKKVTSIPRK